MQNYTKKHLLFCGIVYLFLFVSNYCLAQTQEVDFTFTLHLFDEDLGIDLENHAVQIFEDSARKKKIISGAKGLAKFFLKVVKQYRIVLTGNDNYVEKIILIDTRNIDYRNWKYKHTTQVSLKYHVEVRMFKEHPEKCQDYSFLKTEPVMYLKYDSEYDDLHDFSEVQLEARIKKERKRKCE